MTVLAPSPRLTRNAWRVGMVAAGLLAGVLLAVELRHADFGALLSNLDTRWLALAVLAAGASLLAAVYNLSAFAPVRLRFLDTLRAQLAVCGIRVVTPSAVSTPAICARYLTRSGLGRAESLAAVGTAQIAQLAMTCVVVGLLMISGGTGLAMPDPLPAGIAVASVLVLLAAAAVIARRSARVRQALVAAWQATIVVARHVRQRPFVAATGLLASAGLTLAHVIAFTCCVAAVGGHLSLLTAAAIYLAAASAGSLVPTPGGVGAVEAALIAGLVAAGTGFVTATAATLLVRLIMTWALVPPGLFALRSLRRRGLL